MDHYGRAGRRRNSVPAALRHLDVGPPSGGRPVADLGRPQHELAIRHVTPPVDSEEAMMRSSARWIVGLFAISLTTSAIPAAAVGQPAAGEVVAAWHVTIAPSWFDPSTAPPQIAPFGVLYAIHDALLRPLPGQKIGNSLAESWTESADGRVFEFRLRRGLKFHNGDPITAEDVKFSFDRYRGAGARALQERVRKVEVVDPLTVRFHLHEAWPDFLTFYGTSATAAGIVVPKSYVLQVGDEGFKR